MTTRDMAPQLVAKLRQAIQESGHSLNQLSAECGVDRGRLSRFMRGERDLTFAAAALLCEALGLDLVKVSPRDGRRISVAQAEKSSPRPRKSK
jgi:transcriptional regulator with XRE-family HTH domain